VRINWNPAGILGELDGQNMRLSYLRELDAECRRIFYVVGRDEMADGAPRLEPFPRDRTSVSSTPCVAIIPMRLPLNRIREGDQFGSGFVEINPNSKIPALMDRSGPEPVRVFESGLVAAARNARS
jgi:hypothetical protein